MSESTSEETIKRPSLIEGRMVHYVLRYQDAADINRRRVPNASHSLNWPDGAQAHVGNSVIAGEVFPAIVTRIFPNEFGENNPGVNLQVMLDGNDSLWVTSARYSSNLLDLGTWHWME